MEPKHRAKTVKGFLGAICALAAICVCLLPARGLAQDSAAQTSSTKPTAPPEAAASKKKTSSPARAHSTAVKRSKSSTTSGAHKGRVKYASSRKSSKRKPRGQQKIDSERAQAIQEALIREHYMTGQPTGTWNQASEDAMRRYQADHGWQSKEVPDSRALISLGLGPSNDHLLNPESAMTTAPNISHAAAPVSSTSQSPVSHGADPGPRLSPTPAASSESTPATSDHDAQGPQ
ncbi:MAG: putative peptidoglycan binding domain-containing protein [Candidatus Sulfotelmatobacter sp.]